ncbi:cytochrome P450 2U1-like [Palaemon carinicauda]|uniref:cytochrome P450 2U1-like n=1 Tax=Palaemon carinicauda TaxID=392227 RepID=UPI0035B5ED9A
MTWLTLILLGIVALILYMVLNQPDSKGMPPGPKGLPLIGNLLDLLFEEPPKYFNRMAETYGPLYSIQLGFKRVVVINSSHWLTQAFARQGDMFNHRPRGTVLNFIMSGKGIVDAEDQVWRDSRRFTLHILRDFGMGKSTVEAYVNRELHDFLEAIQKKVGQPYDIHYDVATSILNIVWHMFVGKRFEMGDKTLKWIVDSLELSLTMVEQGGFLNYTPILQFIGTFFKPKAFKVGLNVKHRLEYFTKLIEEHKQNLDNPDREHDFMYQFLIEQRKQKEQGKENTTFTDNQLKWLVSDLFIVSLDTTVTTLRWSMVFLVRHPEIQEKLFQELEAAIGTERHPTYEDRLRMPYMEAFITEIFRYGSITPLAVHGNPEETTLNGYRIPKRSWVVGNIYGIHWDKKVWKDPENFRPERFLDEEGQLIRSEHVVGFSVGRRNCLGESLARIETFQFLTGMLQKFKFGVPPGNDIPSTDYQCGVTLNPKPFNLMVKERFAKAG